MFRKLWLNFRYWNERWKKRKEKNWNFFFFIIFSFGDTLLKQSRLILVRNLRTSGLFIYANTHTFGIILVYETLTYSTHQDTFRISNRSRGKMHSRKKPWCTKLQIFSQYTYGNGFNFWDPLSLQRFRPFSISLCFTLQTERDSGSLLNLCCWNSIGIKLYFSVLTPSWYSTFSF